MYTYRDVFTPLWYTKTPTTSHASYNTHPKFSWQSSATFTAPSGLQDDIIIPRVSFA